MNIDAISGGWFYDDVTKRGVSFDGLLPQACKIPLGNMQDFELIHTPEKMAEFQSNEWYQKNWSLADTLMTFSSLRSEKSVLVEAYRKEMDKILSNPCDWKSCQHDVSSDAWPTQRSCRGLRVLHEDLSQYGEMMTGKNDLDDGKFYDVKKEIYRLTDRVFAALAKCYEVRATGTFAILDELYKKEVFSSEARDNFASASAIAIKLRLSTYLRAGKQGEQLSSNSSNETGKIASVYQLPNEKELFHFFFVTIPLYDELRQFKTSGNIPSSLANHSFFNDSDITTGHIYCRLLNYDKAIKCYERALQKDPENLSVEIRRTRVALFATHNTVESDKIRENLNILLGKVVKNFSQLETNVSETTLEFTPFLNHVDLEECRQLVEGLLFACSIYKCSKYHAVAKKILYHCLTSNKSKPKESLLMRFAFLEHVSKACVQQPEIDAVVSQLTSLIEEEGVSTKSIVWLNRLGEFLFDQGKLEKAYHCFQRALSMEYLLYGARSNVKMMTSLRFLGMIAGRLLMYAESKFYYESLVQLFESFGGINTKLIIKETYLELAGLSFEAYTLDETVGYLKNGLKVATGSKNEKELQLNCSLYCKLATVQHFLHNPEQAWNATLDAQACLRNCTGTQARVSMTCLVAEAFCNINKTKQGIELLKEELQNLTFKSREGEKAACLSVLGKLCLKQGLALEAKKYFEEVLDFLVKKEGYLHGGLFIECLINISKVFLMEGITWRAKRAMWEAFVLSEELPASDLKCSFFEEMGDLCEGICDLGFARLCYNEALNTCKQEPNISKKLRSTEINLEMKLGKLVGKTFSIGSDNSKFCMPLQKNLQAERSHYDRAAAILRQHLATGQVNFITVALFLGLAKSYRSIDKNEQIKLLLETLKVGEIVYGVNKSHEMVASILEHLSVAYDTSRNTQASTKYRELQINMELELYSTKPFHEKIMKTLMLWAFTSFEIPGSNDSIKRVHKFFLSSLNDQAFITNITARTAAPKCFTFLSVLFYTSSDFEKARSLNEQASQLFGEVQESVQTERDPCQKTCDLMKTIFLSEMILPSNKIKLYKSFTNIVAYYVNSLPGKEEQFVEKDRNNSDQEFNKAQNTLVVEQNCRTHELPTPEPLESTIEYFDQENTDTFSAIGVMLSTSDALKYYQNKRDFRQAAEVNAVLKPQLLSLFSKNSFDGEQNGKDQLISHAIKAKDENRLANAVNSLKVALQLPEAHCRRTLKILKLRGECLLSMGNFRSAAIDFTKAGAVYSIETIDNREDLCEFSEVLFGLIKSEILCNNVRAAWLVCEKGIKLTSDHALKEAISKQAMEFFHLGAKCVYILSEHGEDKEGKLIQARSLCQQGLLLCQHIERKTNGHNLVEEVGGSEHGELVTKYEMQLLLVDVLLKLKQKNEAEKILQEMKTCLMNITSKIPADSMSKGKREFVKESRRIWSWLARVLVMLDDIELSVIWLNKSIVAFLSAGLPDFLSSYEELLPLLQAITATKSCAPDERHSSFQQAVDLCKETLVKQGNNLNSVYQFLRTLIIIHTSLGQGQEAMVVAQIALGITDLMSENNVGDKISNRSELLLYLAQIHQQNSLNTAFDAQEEINLAEHYYLSDRGRKEDVILPSDLCYANFLCERRRFAEAVAVLEDIKSLGRKMLNKYVYVDFSSCAFYGAGVEKSVKIDGELFTTVEDVLYNLMVQAYVGIGNKKEAVATCEYLSDTNFPHVQEPVFGMRPSCKLYLLEDCHRKLLSLLNEKDRNQLQNCDFPLSSANLSKLYYKLGEYELAAKYFPKDVESSEMLEMKITCLRLAGNELIDLNRANESLSFFVQFLAILQVKDGFLDKPFYNQCEILQTYYFSNQYYIFRSLGLMQCELENIDAAIQCYERCIDLDEDFTCGQDLVATLSELYQTKALTVDLENKDSRTVDMGKALRLFQQLFQKTAKLTTFVELAFASLLSRLGFCEEAVKHFDKVIEEADDSWCLAFANVDKPLVDVYLRREIEVGGGSVIMPMQVRAEYELILNYIKLGNMNKAKEIAFLLERVVEERYSTSTNLLSRSMVGYAYKQIGNKEKAAEIFESVLEMNPGHPPLTEALESCCM